MHLGILGQAGGWYVEALQRAAIARGDQCVRIDYDSLISRARCSRVSLHAGTIALDNLDILVVRTMPPGSLEQVVFRMDVLGHLADRGTRIFNSQRAVECAVDKHLTTLRLCAANLPTPDTIVCENSESAMIAFEELGGDVVVKPLFGAEGRGILRVDSTEMATRVFRTLERIDAVLYLQKFIRHPGYDLRVLVLGGEILGGIKRFAGADFRTNVSLNGRCEVHSVTAAEADLALRAAACIGADFAGIDLITDQNAHDCWILEVNAVPGWRGFQRATGIPVADRVIDYLHLKSQSK